jgi:8-oxo-dGTP pyrophosphatase MutT (NUDIX family)
MIQQWEKLSSEIVYQKKWMKIREESCKLPDGQIIDPYIIVDVPNFCNVFVVTPDEEVIMVKQYRHAAGIISTEMPGGMIDDGEDPMIAAAREMQEETGYTSKEISLLFTISPNPPLESNRAWFFLARNAVQNHAVALDQFEDIELVKYSKKEFMQCLLNNEFTHGIQLGAMFAAAIQLGWLVTP